MSHFSLTCTACSWQGADADLAQCLQCAATVDIRYADSALPIVTEQPSILKPFCSTPVLDQ